MRVRIPLLLCACLLAMFGLPARAQNGGSPAEAMMNGTPIFNLRLRYENVDQENLAEKGEALTLRTLAGWKTGVWSGFSGTIELIDVGRANDDYNDTLNGKTQYPVIADPDNTDVNQLYLDFAGIPDTRIRGGRQSINLDKVRMVGDVRFRQVMQVFNGLTLENSSIPDTKLFAGYLGRVKTITTKQYDTDILMLNVNYRLAEENSLVGYAYLQDQSNAISATAFNGGAPSDTSNLITGIRADGGVPVGEGWRLLYTAEYATQSDYADGDVRIDADYLRLGGGASWSHYVLRMDYEQLGSNNGAYAFQTPLGTNHLYQGWADQFLITPPAGIQDIFLSARVKLDKATVMAEFHRMESDVGNTDWGDEFDLSVSYPLMKQLVGTLEYANYQAGTNAGKPDVTKFWFTLMFTY